jgi:WD40 repeat protein
LSQVRFSGDGKRIATACNDRTLRVWNVESGEMVQKWEDCSCCELALSSDAMRFYLKKREEAEKAISGFDVGGGKPLPHDFETFQCAVMGAEGFEVSSDDSLLVARANSGVQSSRLFICNLSSGKLLGQSHDAPIPSWLGQWGYSQDSRSMFMTDLKALVIPRTQRYSLSDGKCQESYPGAFLDVGQNDKKLATLSSQTLCVWELSTGKKQWEREIRDNSTGAFSADGTKIVFEDPDRTLRVADANTGKVIEEYQPLPIRINPELDLGNDGSVVFSSNLEYVAIAEEKSAVVRVMEWRTGNTIMKLDRSPIAEAYRLGFSPDGQFLVLGVSDKPVELWHVANKKQATELPQGSFAGFAQDGRFLRLRTANSIALWDMAKNKLMSTVAVPEDMITWTISADSKMLAIAGKGEVTIWEVGTGKLRRRFENVGSPLLSLGFGPDCRTLLTATDTSLLIWDVVH